jgi:hypothetical protein
MSELLPPPKASLPSKKARSGCPRIANYKPEARLREQGFKNTYTNILELKKEVAG